MRTIKKEYVFLIFSVSVLGIGYFFDGFFSFSYIKIILWNFILLLLIATGISGCAKSNSLNLGNEGQVYFGAFLAYIFCDLFGLTYFNFILIMILSSSLVGLIGLVPFYLTFFFKINGMLTGVLMSYGNQRLVDGFISNVLASNRFLSQTKSIDKIFTLDTSLPYLLLFGILVWGLYVFVHKKTIIGLKLEILGDRKLLGKFFGVNEFKYKLLTVFSSAFLNGLVGAIFLVFFKNYLFLGLTVGIGWNGFIIAVISGFNYMYVLFFSLFFSMLNEFNNYLKINYSFKYEFIGLCQAVSICISLFLMNSSRK
ncbi:ABC transporter permease [Candidatus Borreliella tachyglossi]|uniref:ABC transporter permease n=1 Tax=Candidatus Borreliella tachyglossi TaxID=1964448 RepID=A0A2S1LWN2_9SPIR|nr:ABC transporter permease [Candidatus Borreliella tachyglossi]AWG42703.1 ABC transporter permease [Candidatus Borreliella tachyglossi]